MSAGPARPVWRFQGQRKALLCYGPMRSPSLERRPRSEEEAGYSAIANAKPIQSNAPGLANKLSLVNESLRSAVCKRRARV
jgi:hypothetical protein